MYKITRNSFTNKIECIARTADHAYIPVDEANSDYQAYLAWVAEGNTATEWKPVT